MTNPLAKLALFALALLATFAGGVAIGAAVDPGDAVPTAPPTTHEEHAP